LDPGAAYHRSAHRKQTWHLAASSRLVKDRAILVTPISLACGQREK
jgi:hypothetical protein